MPAAPAELWLAVVSALLPQFSDATMADALKDSWLQGSYSIEPAVESLRKRNAPEPSSNSKKFLP
jgi:hypothetical protein